MRWPRSVWLIVLVLMACGKDTSPPRHGEPRLRRLLATQYTNSIEALLGASAAAVAQPPPDIASQGFESIGASELAPGDSALTQYEKSARIISELAVADVSKLPPIIGCTPASDADLACFETFVRTFGRRAFRRTLTDPEIDRYLTLVTTVASRYRNAYAGIAFGISAFLQSPNFLYQVEIGEVDPGEPTRRRLTGNEIATRMSYFLTNRPPDDALIDLAEAGMLVTEEEIRAKAIELVNRPEARDALDAFYEERFKLRKLASLTKDPAEFPEWNIALGEAMRTEALLLLRDVVWDQDTDFRQLLDANYAFVNGPLAQLYGTSPVFGTADLFEKRMLPPERRGILGQGGFLSNEAHPTSTSPTRRGRFLSERVLCIEIPPPPPDVMTELPPPVPGMPQTMRQRLAAHATDEGCASCHLRMDGIGLALEHFDPIGRFRTTDNGLPIDVSGEVFEVGPFSGPAGFVELVRDMPELHRCWVRGLYRHATGHIEAEADDLALQDVEGVFEKSHRVKELMVELVVSDAFRYVDNKVESN